MSPSQNCESKNSKGILSLISITTGLKLFLSILFSNLSWFSPWFYNAKYYKFLNTLTDEIRTQVLQITRLVYGLVHCKTEFSVKQNPTANNAACFLIENPFSCFLYSPFWHFFWNELFKKVRYPGSSTYSFLKRELNTLCLFFSPKIICAP